MDEIEPGNHQKPIEIEQQLRNKRGEQKSNTIIIVF